MAHNVTVVANHPLPKPKPWFGWQTVLNGKIFSVKEEMNFVTIECGYEKQSLYPYRRLIKYDTALSVFEFVEQCRSVDKDAETYFLLHPDLKINPRPNAIDLLSENRPIARLLYDQLCTMRTKQGRTTMQYGLFRETTMLVFEWKTSPVSTVAFKIGLYDSLSEKA
jgi:hypothetical protein